MDSCQRQIVHRLRIGGFALVALALLGTRTPEASGQSEPLLAAGKYRLEMILASTTRVPFFGSSQSASRSVSLVEIRHEGGAAIQSHKVCDFRVLEDSAFIKMVFPEKFISSLASPSYRIQLTHYAGGVGYRSDLGLETVGYKGASDGKLPAGADAPGVFDWDGDGHPGATLKISIPLLPDGELYVVQKGHSILHGRVENGGKVVGTIEYKDFEQRVVGAWPGFLNRSPEVTPDPKNSRFTLAPVPEQSRCADIAAAPGSKTEATSP